MSQWRTSLYPNFPVGDNILFPTTVSLFTSIPTLVIDRWCISTYFCFNCFSCRQLNGSPLSPFLRRSRQDSYLSASTCFSTSLCIRYVGIVSKTLVVHLIKVFDNYNPNLQFTYDLKINSPLIFWISVEGNKLLNKLVPKPTLSGRVISYHSNHPFFQNRAMVNTWVVNSNLYIMQIFWWLIITR